MLHRTEVRARINLRPAAGYLITSFGHTPSSFLLNRRRHCAYEPVTGRLVHPPFVHAQVGYVTIMAAFLLIPCDMIRMLQLEEGFRRICCRIELLGALIEQ
jgi:hypothetical protein